MSSAELTNLKTQYKRLKRAIETAEADKGLWDASLPEEARERNKRFLANLRRDAGNVDARIAAIEEKEGKKRFAGA